MNPIKNITTVISYIVETESHTYRTDGNGNWEVVMGESWETHHFCAAIEAAFQLYITPKCVCGTKLQPVRPGKLQCPNCG